MDIYNPSAVIGTNAWGGKFYGKAIRGNYVSDTVIKEAMKEAAAQDMGIYDLARDYGFGKAQRMMGEFGTKDVIISAKYTPFTHYRKGCVRRSLTKDLRDFRRDYVDIYWLHLPTDIEAHLKEIAELYKEGKIKHIGVSNFTLEECERSKEILERFEIPLYGVQNHYSIICRDWEQNGLLKWCRDNGILFWGWAVLEEGVLTDPRVRKSSPMKFAFNRKIRKLEGLYKVMIEVAEQRGLKVPQVAMAFCSSKGVVPMVGCRKPEQVKDLSQAISIRLTGEEIECLEEAADNAAVKIMGADIFRPFVFKEKSKSGR
ncbi:MAG: aldo/keto reductase [Lachnospiraceae bacterium]|nr:aldo/keto reductase [Lachnospiraceae bacterium]